MSDYLEKAQMLGANQAGQEMDTFVPERTGDLRGSRQVVNGGKTIRWAKPYGYAQFRGIANGGRIVHYHTPGTSRRWDLRFKGDKQKMDNVTSVIGKVVADGLTQDFKK